jgi:hypothetical protein
MADYFKTAELSVKCVSKFQNIMALKVYEFLKITNSCKVADLKIVLSIARSRPALSATRNLDTERFCIKT